MALSANRAVKKKEGEKVEVPVAGSTTIYQGMLVARDTNGYAAPAADNSNHVFHGIALEEVDNSSGSNGDANIVVQRRGSHKLPVVDPHRYEQDALGGSVYVNDDEYVADNDQIDNSVRVGTVVALADDGDLWVDIEPGAEAGTDWALAGSTTTTA